MSFTKKLSKEIKLDESYFGGPRKVTDHRTLGPVALVQPVGMSFLPAKRADGWSVRVLW